LTFRQVFRRSSERSAPQGIKLEPPVPAPPTMRSWPLILGLPVLEALQQIVQARFLPLALVGIPLVLHLDWRVLLILAFHLREFLPLLLVEAIHPRLWL
jgi:hypothetical protein